MADEPVWRRYDRITGEDPAADVEAELSFHYEMRVRDYMDRGMDEVAARAAARERLGDVNVSRRECDAIDEAAYRARRRRAWLGELRQDVKYGVRMLMRSPVFTAVAVLTLALGLGGTTAIFSVVNRVLLSPLPYPDPDRLVNVWEHSPQGDDHNSVSPGNYVDWRRMARSFTELGAYGLGFNVAMTGEGEPKQVSVAEVTPAALRVLGTAPLVGRWLSDTDADGDGAQVLISHAFWRQQFGSDPAVLGRTIILNDIAHEIVGVMPPRFGFPNDEIQLWRTMSVVDVNPNERRSHTMLVIGRLKPDMSIERASAEMNMIAGVIAREHPEHMQGWRVNVVGMHEDLTGDVRPMLLVLMSVVGVVLLIACSNLANLLLARAITRENEIALRGALGAGRSRIVRQLLTESLVLAVAGAIVGVGLAAIGLRQLLAAAPQDIPMLRHTTIDWRVLAAAAAVTAASTLLFGLMPALRLSRSGLHDQLRARRMAGRRAETRWRGALLVAEVALTVVLLVGGGLLVRSFIALQNVDLGYNHENLVALSQSMPWSRYQGNAKHIDFAERLVDRIRAIPGVVAATGSAHRPASGQGMTFSFAIEGRVARNPSGREDPESLIVVGPDYFRTLGIPVLSGRAFDERDRADGVPVAIISQSLARKHWPNESPIGKRINLRPGEAPWIEIVGVVGDVRMESPDVAPVPTLYMPHAQKPWTWLSWFTVVARLSAGADPEALRPHFKAAIYELDPLMPMQDYATVDDLYGNTISRRSFSMTLVIAFATVALLLSIIGLYGLVAYSVEQQKQQIGIRMALGATPADILSGVLLRSMRLAGIGLVLGIAGALALTRFMESLLFDISPTDPLTIAAIVCIVLMTTMFAGYIPARRAARETALSALRL